MGNQLQKSYETLELCASGGPNLVWKIHTGKKIDTTETVSVWFFDKKQIERHSKSDRDRIIEVLKRDVQMMSRLRHPQIVRVCQSIVEDKLVVGGGGGGLVFETEPIFASLSNVYRNYKNMDTVPERLHSFSLEPLEIKLGMGQITTALQFLHQNANIIHGNITPENIFITPDGQWKLGGLNYSRNIGQEENYEYPDTANDMFDPKPNLDYIAPECIIHKQMNAKSDMFSLGCVLYFVHTGENLLQSGGSARKYRSLIAETLPLKENVLSRNPQELVGPLNQLLTSDIQQRIDVGAFLQSTYFSDVLSRALNYLAHILEKDHQSKSLFFKGLVSALPQFTDKILYQKVLPPLLESLRDTIMIPFLLPLIFSIGRRVSQNIWNNEIFPHLIQVFTIPEPFQIPLLLLQSCEFLLQHSSDSMVRLHILPFIFNSFSHPRVDVQLAVLMVVPKFDKLVTPEQLKHSIFPRIQQICLSETQDQAVRIKALECYSHLIPISSVQLITETIYPVSIKCLSSNSPHLRTAAITICEVVSLKVGINITSREILPVLIPLLTDRDLNFKQFKILSSVVKGMMNRIESSRLSDYKTTEQTEGQSPSNTELSSTKEDTPENQQNESQSWESSFQSIPAAATTTTTTPVTAATTATQFQPQEQPQPPQVLPQYQGQPSIQSHYQEKPQYQRQSQTHLHTQPPQTQPQYQGQPFQQPHIQQPQPQIQPLYQPQQPQIQPQYQGQPSQQPHIQPQGQLQSPQAQEKPQYQRPAQAGQSQQQQAFGQLTQTPQLDFFAGLTTTTATTTGSTFSMSGLGGGFEASGGFGGSSGLGSGGGSGLGGDGSFGSRGSGVAFSMTTANSCFKTTTPTLIAAPQPQTQTDPFFW